MPHNLVSGGYNTRNITTCHAPAPLSSSGAATASNMHSKTTPRHLEGSQYPNSAPRGTSGYPQRTPQRTVVKNQVFDSKTHVFQSGPSLQHCAHLRCKTEISHCPRTPPQPPPRGREEKGREPPYNSRLVRYTQQVGAIRLGFRGLHAPPPRVRSARHPCIHNLTTIHNTWGLRGVCFIIVFSSHPPRERYVRWASKGFRKRD
jgi:hypothetical protein